MSTQLYYIRNKIDFYLLPNENANWYHNRPTFTPEKEKAGTYTEEQADALLQLPAMHPGARKEAVGS